MRNVLTGCGFLISIITGWAQPPSALLNIHDYRVVNQSTELTGGSMVRHIMQDSRGFMWFATTKGLVRYDGTNYRHYYHHPGKPRSLGGNSVKEIRETPSGELYLALNDAGLSRFNPNAPENEAFTNYRHDPGNPRSIPTSVLFALEIDRAGIVWMGGKNTGLIRFDPRRQQFTSVRWPVPPSDDLDQSVYDILADPDGSIWVGTSNTGLLRYWPATGQFEVYSLQSMIPANFAKRNGTGSLYLDITSQVCWFGSVPLGLCRLDKRTRKITTVPGILSDTSRHFTEYIMDISQDKAGALWVAHSARGLYQYFPSTQSVTHIPLVKMPSGNQRIECSFLDRSGVLWVATAKGVVRYTQAAGQLIRRYSIKSSTGLPLLGVQRVEQDERGDCWLELIDRLLRYDTLQQTVVETIRLPSDLLRIGTNHIQVSGNEVFIHASNREIFYLDSKSRKISPLYGGSDHQRIKPIRQAQYDRQRIFPDTVAGQPVLWIGTLDRGLMRYWVNTHRIERIPLGSGERAIQNTERVLRDRSKIIWVATNGQGLFQIRDGKTTQAIQYWANPTDASALPENELADLLEDHQGTLWVATLTHGLVRVNQRHGRVSFTTFDQFPDGPPSRIFSFVEDHAHLFWVTAGDGLYLFNPATGRFLKHAATDQALFRVESEEISLSPDGFTLTIADGAILKGSDARSMFDVPRNPPLHFTDFRIFNQSHPELLTHASGGVQLSHTQNQFSIEFAAPWFQHPEQIRYRYQLAGFDPGWTEIDTRREAFYTNIPHGQYTFKVQASWDGSDHFLRTIELPIVITPAYWETGWFIGIVTLLLVLIAWAVWSYRQRETTLKANLLLAQAEKRQRETELREHDALFQRQLADTEMTALRAQMNPHFIFNCLNSIKLYTLQNDTDLASDYLTRFARLIRLVLENSRADRVTLRNELEALQLYSDLEAMRFKHKVRVSIRVDPDIDQQLITIPPLLLQPYVENAIWHGLMHRMEGGIVRIDVSQPTDELLHVEVVDDGIGREKAALLKSKSAGNHKSFGMQVTADRIRMINELYNTQTQARIVDLVAPNGDPLGTKVVLDIPI